MKALSVRPPHVERLTARVRALDGPLVQLWAWAGAGQQAVLDVLTEDARFGQPLSLDALADEAALRRAVEAAFESGARWLVLPAVPSLPAASAESAGFIARLLTPGQRLVFSAPRRRPPGPLACSYLLPEEFLLGEEELAELWRGVTGADPGDALVERLRAATDGWYRPLRLAAEAAAEAGGSVEPEALAEIPSVASFLRHEVLALLDDAERDLLVELAAAGDVGAALWDAVLEAPRRSLRTRLLEEWGLALEGLTGLRLPTLLRSFLDAEREARWPPSRRRELARRLGRAELAAGHPVRALEHLLAAAGERSQGPRNRAAARPGSGGGPGGAEPELAALLDAHWPRLLAAAPLGLLERAVDAVAAGRAGDGASPAGFLAVLVEALLWRRDGAVASLLGFRREPAAGRDGGPVEDTEGVADAPELAAAVGLAAELLGSGTGVADVEPTAAQEHGGKGSAGARADADGADAGGAEAVATPGAGPPWLFLPPELRPLRVLVELRRAVAEEAAGEPEAAPAADESGEGSGAAAAAALLVPALARVEPVRRPPSLRGGETAAGEAAATPRHAPLQALFERGLLDLLRRRPALPGELGRRGDLPAPWRRWLAGLPPAGPASESAGYGVHLLGKPTVRLRRPGGRSVEVRFPLRRAFQVFAFLAAAPGLEATRDELVEAVWHDEDEATVEKNFHPTLSYVRRALEAGGEAEAPPVLLRRGVYRLNPRLPWNVDVAELERRAGEGRRLLEEGQPEQAIHLWESAWGLYRGPFLAGWDGPWIGARRDQLQQVHLRLLVALGEACEGLGRLTRAMDAYRSALIEDALQERVHLALMRIYARQGRRDLVRRQYERLSALLSEELGVEPLPETTESYHRLMA